MPKADQQLENTLLRTMLYGPAKSKKTWWACCMAELGFNVLLIDSDDGSQILLQLPLEARAKIDVIKCHDQFSRPVASIFMALFLRGQPFIWDQTTFEHVPFPNLAKPEHKFYSIDAKKLTANDVVIFDSWSAIVISLMLQWFNENKIDPSVGQQAVNTNWDVYRWAGAVADWMISKLKSLPCHVIIIGHSSDYEKRATVTDPATGKRVVEVISTRTQPISVSGPHSKKLADKFTDILVFEMLQSQVMINTKPKEGMDCGSRIVPPGLYKWEELNVRLLCQYGNIQLPVDAQPTGWIEYLSGEAVRTAFQPAAKKQLQIPVAQPVLTDHRAPTIQAAPVKTEETGAMKFNQLLTGKKD